MRMQRMRHVTNVKTEREKERKGGVREKESERKRRRV